MVKSELISEINKAVNRETQQSSYKETEAHVNQILESICETLTEGGRIEIRGFGSFSLHHHPPRKAHNPKTKERMVTQSKYSPHFKPGKEMRKKINDSRDKPLVDETAATSN